MLIDENARHPPLYVRHVTSDGYQWLRVQHDQDHAAAYPALSQTFANIHTYVCWPTWSCSTLHVIAVLYPCTWFLFYPAREAHAACLTCACRTADPLHSSMLEPDVPMNSTGISASASQAQPVFMTPYHAGSGSSGGVTSPLMPPVFTPRGHDAQYLMIKPQEDTEL